MGQAKRRGTPEERAALAIAWDEAYREDRERFPPAPISHIRDHGKSWMPVLEALALANQSRGTHLICR